MAPPTTKPRLADMDPESLARDVVRRALDHVQSIVTRIDPTWSARIVTVMGGDGEMPVGPDAHGLGIYATVVRLAHYARTGALGDWQDDACAQDAVLDVMSLLYSEAGSGEIRGGEYDAADHDPETPIGLVIVAAMARMRLADRHTAGVSARELGALAGITATQVRHLSRAGEIALEDGVVPRREARRFLAARGVPGFARAKTA